MISSNTPGGAKPAFEISKGKQSVLVLSEAQVMELLDPVELLDELEKSFGALVRGEVQCPPGPRSRSQEKASRLQ